MIYVDLLQATFDLTLTLGDADTNNPPPLLLTAVRKGTNFSVSFVLPIIGIITGERFVTYTGILTAPFTESGQYNFYIFDNTIPASPVEIERGLLIALTTPITKETYGTDKTRGEYKGHL